MNPSFRRASVLGPPSSEPAELPTRPQFGPTNNYWYCVSCARIWDDVDPEFWEIVDGKTGSTYTREQVELDFLFRERTRRNRCGQP